MTQRQKKIMELVNTICNTESDCHGMANNCFNVNELLCMSENVPEYCRVIEVPINWGQQVLIIYKRVGEENECELFAGIGTDGEFYFEVTEVDSESGKKTTKTA